MPTSPNLALPYPVSTDSADVPRDIKALTDKLDGYTSLHPPVVSSLPGSPVDGQEIYFLADAANGVVWRLRYRAAATGSYKWEIAGGATPLYAEVVTNENTASTTYAALATPGPVVTLPLAGDYVVDQGFWMNNVAAGNTLYMSYDIGATAAVDADAVLGQSQSAAVMQASMIRRRRKTGLAAVALTAKYRGATAGGGYYGNRWLSAQPVRVG